MSLTFLFRCNIAVSHKKPSASKPYAFPTTLPWLWFVAKRPLVVSHCPWSTVPKSKRLWYLTFWGQITTVLYLLQSWIPYSCPPGMGAACHCWTVMCSPASCSHHVLCQEFPSPYPSPGRNLLLSSNVSSSSISTPTPPRAASLTCSSGSVRQNYI